MNPSFWGTANLRELLEGTVSTHHKKHGNPGRRQSSNESYSSDVLTTMTDDSNSFRTNGDGGEWGFVRSDDLSNTTSDFGGFFNTNGRNEIAAIHQMKQYVSIATNDLSWKTPSPNPIGKRKLKRGVGNFGSTTTTNTALTPMPIAKGLSSSRSPTSVMDIPFPQFPQTVPALAPPPSDSKILETTSETRRPNGHSILLSPPSNCSSPGKHSVGRTVSRKRMMAMRRRSNNLQKPDFSSSSWSSSRSDHQQQQVAEQQQNDAISEIEKSPLSRRRRRVYDSQRRPDFYYQEISNKSLDSRSLEGIYDIEKSPSSPSTRSLSRRIQHGLMEHLEDEILPPGSLPSRRRLKKTNLKHKSEYESNESNPLEKSPTSLSRRKTRLVRNKPDFEDEDHLRSPIIRSPSSRSVSSRRRLSGLLQKGQQVDTLLEGDIESLSLSSILKSPTKNRESQRGIRSRRKLKDNAREEEVTAYSMKARRRRQLMEDLVGTLVDTAYHDSEPSSSRRSSSSRSTIGEDTRRQKAYQTTTGHNQQEEQQENWEQPKQQKTVKMLHGPNLSPKTSISNTCSRNDFLAHKRKLVNLDEFLLQDPNSLTNRYCEGGCLNGKPPFLNQLPTTHQQNDTEMGQPLDENKKANASSSCSPSSTEERTSSFLAQSEAGTSARTLLRDVGYPENYITTTNTNMTVSTTTTTTTSSDENESNDNPVTTETFTKSHSSMHEIPRNSTHPTWNSTEQVSKRNRYRRRRKLATFQQLLGSNPPTSPPTKDKKESKETTTTGKTKIPYNSNGCLPHLSDTSKYTPRDVSRDGTPSYLVRRNHHDGSNPTVTPASTSNRRIPEELDMFWDDTSIHNRTGGIDHIEGDQNSARNAPAIQIDTKTEEIVNPTQAVQNNSFGQSMNTKISDLSTAQEYRDVIKSTNPRLDKIRKKKRDIEARVQNKTSLGESCTSIMKSRECVGNEIPSISIIEDDCRKPSQLGGVSTYPCRREVSATSVDYTFHGPSDNHMLPSAVHHLNDGKFRFHPSSEAQKRSCISHPQQG